MRRMISAVAAVLLLVSSPSLAEPLGKDDPLYTEMLALDDQVFERGFNQCDLEVYNDIIADDFEFFHDVAGPSYGREKFISDTKEGICASDYHPRRALVKGSVEVFPLYDNGALYGALVNGEHMFFQTPPGGAEQLTGRAKFSMFWIRQDDRWLLKRVFSYDHSAAGAND